MIPVEHRDIQSDDAHEPKHITNAVVEDAGKVLTPSGEEPGRSVLRALLPSEVGALPAAGGVLTGSLDINTSDGLSVQGVKVVGARGAAVANANDVESVYTGIDSTGVGAVYATVADLNALRVAYEDVRATLNLALARLRAHGLIGT